jgi:hypothetical protein
MSEVTDGKRNSQKPGVGDEDATREKGGEPGGRDHRSQVREELEEKGKGQPK